MALIRSTMVFGPQLALRSSSATATAPMCAETSILSLERGQPAVLDGGRAGKVNLGLEDSNDERRHWTAAVRL